MNQAEHLILEALQASVSQDPVLLKEAERRFEEWVLEPGYYAILIRVLCNRSLQHDVRLMAVTQIKNGVDLYWRRNTANRVSSEEKVLIKGLLLENLDEPSDQITRQVGELMARIARSDCPHDWPELLPTLTENVQGGSSLLRWRSLFFLYRVMKTLSSKRLQKDRETFYELTSKLFMFLVGLWKSYRDSVSRHLEGGLEAGPVQAACQSLEQARTCLKVLRLMVVHGVLRFNTVLEPLTFVSETFDQVKVFTDMRLRVRQSPQLEEAVEKIIAIHMKTLIDVQSHHPINFVPFITPSLELAAHFLFTDEGSSKLFARFALQLLTLLRLILRCEEYKPPYSHRLVEVTPPPQVLEAIQLKKTFFSAEMLNDISRKLVTHYLVLREEELKAWHSDPEEFLKEEAEANLEFSISECVQVVLLTLLNEYRLTIAPVLYSLIEAFQNTGPTADEQSLLIKEAVYKMAGLAAHDLYDVIDFDSWYSTHLLQELEIREPRYQIVRTRVVWMVGNWVGVKMSQELFPSLYKVLVTLLDPQELLIMRVNAAESLRHAVDELNFDSEAFSPFLPDTMARLQHLLGCVQEGRTKMMVVGVISSIVERVDRAIQPHVEALVQQLPDLWGEGGGDDLVQGAILDMLQMLVRSLGPLSTQLHHILLPIVDMATDIKQCYHVHLGEVALELWGEVLRHATTMTPDLLTLLGNMGGVLGVGLPADDSGRSIAGLLDMEMECLQRAFEVMDSYLLLDGASVLRSYSQILMEACESYMDEVKPECLKPILAVVGRVVQLFPEEGPTLIRPCLDKMMNRIFSTEDGYPRVTCAYLLIVARVMFQNFPFFLQYLQELSATSGQNVVDLFAALLEIWSDKLDVMVELEQRKMTGLTMASLLSVRDQCVTARFGTLLNMCIEVLHDIVDTNFPDTEGSMFDTLCKAHEKRLKTQQVEEVYNKTEQDIRSYAVESHDPLYVLSLHEYVASQLQAAQTIYGDAEYSTLIACVDPVILEQLSEYVPQIATSLAQLQHS